MKKLIDLYTAPTPNGRKVSILLEELSVAYNCISVDLSRKRSESFKNISPNNKIPAIFDHENSVSLMESGAILLYLAEKYDGFIVKEPGRWQTIEWLMWQMSAVGPTFGQVHHFSKYNPGISEYSEIRHKKELNRLYEVLNNHLFNRQYVSGPGKGIYTITDIAIWPWISRFEWHDINLRDFKNLYEWYINIASRPSVKRGYQIPYFVHEIPTP